MNVKITAVKFEVVNGKKVGKSITLSLDPEEMAMYKTEAALRKGIEGFVLRTGVFNRDDLKDLKYNMKEFLEEWKDQLSKVNVEETAEPEYDLDRFLGAQSANYDTVVEELTEGMKSTHWIWYIFPQQKGLGHSYNSEYYGLDGLDEARAYLAHVVLGARLRECCTILLVHKGNKDIYDIMGSRIDVLKLHTCMELFDTISPNDIFKKVLDAFF